MAAMSPKIGPCALTRIKPARYPRRLTWIRASVRAPAETVPGQADSREPAMKEDNITPKLLFTIALFAAVSFAVWSGFATDVEAPAQATTQAAGMLTPF